MQKACPNQLGSERALDGGWDETLVYTVIPDIPENTFVFVFESSRPVILQI